MRQSERATTRITDTDLETAAQTQEEAAQEMKYILTSITTGGAATVCRQHQHETGYAIYRQLTQRYSIPVGTRGIGYLTKLLKPTLDPHTFDETFSTGELGLSRFEQDNGTTLPDQVKVAILLNETKGPLQQHLQLLAGTNQTYNAIRETIMDYYRTTTAISRMQAGQQAPSSSVSTSYNGGAAPMDIGAIKGKGHTGKGYGKGKGYGWNKGKGGKGQSKGYKGKSKGKQYKGKTPIGYGQNSGTGWHQQQQGNHKGKGKSKHKGKQTARNICYRCGLKGHMAKDCAVAVYNLNDVSAQQHPDPPNSQSGGQTTDKLTTTTGGMKTKHMCRHSA